MLKFQNLNQIKYTFFICIYTELLVDSSVETFRRNVSSCTDVPPERLYHYPFPK
ncbi:MAG: hypothetical protein KME54_04105 [Tolypothrix brevis GSE-NOS-MK-07-07A]|nr:hypothetical protein [Tolypothrix brevis GSE-NOS-MK-07-07A]